MAATLKDIVRMLKTEKHKAKNKHAFTTPSKGFYDDPLAAYVTRPVKKNIVLSIQYLAKYRRPD
ncbi:MAG: hypothetical protein M9939_02225 [Mesorhizobium sp.]|nr:hypothetical protein [Mesorhizobium sp.]MCO5159925.1 hypothetical protein [Mesorhizobium sp.]